jgi:hypothetical protein
MHTFIGAEIIERKKKRRKNQKSEMPENKNRINDKSINNKSQR